MSRGHEDDHYFAYHFVKKERSSPMSHEFHRLTAIHNSIKTTLIFCAKWKTLLLQKDTYLNYSQALSQNLAGLRKKGPIRKLSTNVGHNLDENWKRLWVMAVWIGAMAGLFTWKFIQYRNRYTSPRLKALILLPVCRNTVAWLRSTRLSRILPFDGNINFT